jgi:hypothetical protein
VSAIPNISSKDLRVVVKKLVGLGAVATFDGHGHVRVTMPSGAIHTFPSTTKNFHTINKAKVLLKRVQAGGYR